ncbi:MAG: hypothetical protein IJ745_00775 [Bacteroidales bacterium]|nr:hypothetical protein [Bacteroidales bacterium]
MLLFDKKNTLSKAIGRAPGEKYFALGEISPFFFSIFAIGKEREKKTKKKGATI